MKINSIIIIVLLLLLPVSIMAEPVDPSKEGRRILELPNKDGTYQLLTNLGECDLFGCVLQEKTANNGYIHQWYDIFEDGKCDRIIIWKPIVDPAYGTFYIMYKTRPCIDGGI